jgi:hypothetical protein
LIGDNSFLILDKNDIYGAPVIMSGKVRKRSKIFFYKKRLMVVLEDGRLLFKKDDGKIEEEMKLEKNTEVTL